MELVFGSIITIPLLSFEPFTQKVIDIGSQRAILTNASGFVSTTNRFTVEGTRGDLTQLLAPTVLKLLFSCRAVRMSSCLCWRVTGRGGGGDKMEVFALDAHYLLE